MPFLAPKDAIEGRLRTLGRLVDDGVQAVTVLLLVRQRLLDDAHRLGVVQLGQLTLIAVYVALFDRPAERAAMLRGLSAQLAQASLPFAGMALFGLRHLQQYRPPRGVFLL